MNDNATRPLELGIVIPTFNEGDNVEPVLRLLAQALPGIEYEVIFVDDDSPDRTSARVREVARGNPRVRILQRIGRRGLSSACLEGMMATPAPFIAVMDADLQHDERILPVMLARLQEQNLDLVIASRNAEGGTMGEFAKSRVRLSQLGRRLSHLIARADLSDPMSGFFVMDRRFLEEVAHRVSGVGFKILLDLVASSARPVRFAEVAYTFRQRIHGSSKLDILVGVEYLQMLLDKSVGNLVPARFLLFGMVGAIGYLIFIGLLAVLVAGWSVPFVEAQIVTTYVEMAANFFLNNTLTYRDRRLRGTRLWTGLITFLAACSVGALVNVRVALFLRDSGFGHYAAGGTGLAIGSVWNYGITSLLTWRQQRRRSRV